MYHLYLAIDNERDSVEVYQVESDNFEGLCTKEFYQELTLSMSSGDHGAHKVKRIYVTPQEADILRIREKLLY